MARVADMIETTLNRTAVIAVELLCLSFLMAIGAYGQVTRAEPEQSKWGQTLAITYYPSARGEKFALTDEVYMRVSLGFPDAEETLVVKMSKAGPLFKYELPVKTNLDNLQFQFFRLPDGQDSWGRMSVMIYRPDGEPARGAYLSKALSRLGRSRMGVH
jgi:hypothetical protein